MRYKKANPHDLIQIQCRSSVNQEKKLLNLLFVICFKIAPYFISHTELIDDTVA